MGIEIVVIVIGVGVFLLFLCGCISSCSAWKRKHGPAPSTGPATVHVIAGPNNMQQGSRYPGTAGYGPDSFQQAQVHVPPSQLSSSNLQRLMPSAPILEPPYYDPPPPYESIQK